ncbi:MAG: DUF3098 domain-containing protein [Bacteroidetes bacterium]|nr:DUF3098 domain-containing protein [Bacteroidota bacterium]
MAKKNTNQKNVKKNAKKSVKWNFPYNKTDLIWLLVGIGVVVLGYVLMATGITEEPAIPEGVWNNHLAVNVAPVVLFIGYLVIIPLALFKFFSRPKKNKEADDLTSIK